WVIPSEVSSVLAAGAAASTDLRC
ncbi:hypothetical protein A2U01_0020578, partial [Trifolium medium]|nr:hypothetical protein [Trifolium medium]